LYRPAKYPITLGMHKKTHFSGTVFKTLFQQFISPALIRRLFAQHGPAHRCPPKVTAVELMMGLVFHLLAGAGTLAQHMKQLTGKTITDGALSQRRLAVPWAIFAGLIAAALRPKADAKWHPQAFYKGLRLCGVDGSQFSVANTPQVKTQMKKAASRRLKAAFAKVGAVVMVELGLHNPIAAAIGHQEESEMKLAEQLLGALPEDSLLIGDRYYGVPKVLIAFKKLYPQGRREFLVRVRSNLKPRYLEVYGDGSALVEIKSQKQTLLVREIVGRVRRGNKGWSTVRLWTSLLDWKQYPAAALLAQYAHRWEEESFYRELKVDMRSAPLVQSHTPLTAAQEIAALIMAYAILVDERIKAAHIGQVPVLRISFLKTLEAVRGLWSFLELSFDLLTPDKVRLLVRRTLRRIAAMALPKRRQRTCPRALRQPVSSWPRLLENRYQTGAPEYEITPIPS
jgi:hypothetical protein